MPRPRKTDPTQPADESPETRPVTEDVPTDPAPVTKPVTTVETGLPPLADLPEPSQEIFDAPRESAPESETGEVWDETIHESPPRKNAKGGWARRRGGARKAGTSPHAHRPTAKKPGEPELSEQEITDKIDAAATLSAGLVFLCGTMIVGPCMEPDDTERAGITSAFRDYYRTAGIIEIPPWVGLVGALTLYGARRWNHPEVKAITGRDKKDATSPSVN